jgi:hypothetical protein
MLEGLRGNIFFCRGNVRIQVVTDEKIYFVLIDKDTFMPTIENVMYNYMGCEQMMFGPLVRNGITYKGNFPGFVVYKKKYFHNFKVQVSDKNYEGAKGCNLGNMKAYAVGINDTIQIFDDYENKLL